MLKSAFRKKYMQKIRKIDFQWILLNYKVQNCKCPKMQYIGHYVCSGIRQARAPLEIW